MIRNIIFDMGGVLIDFDPDKTLHKYFDEQDAAAVQRVLFDSGLWKNLDLGTMHSAQIADEACKSLPPRLHDALTTLVTHWWDEMPALDGMEAFVQELKDNGYRAYLCSNTSDDIYLYKSRYPVMRLLDGICASCDYGVIKPDARLFEALYRQFSLRPEECFFIDDLPQNIAGAAQTGMVGHCFADKDLQRLRDAMRDRGIHI